MKKIFLFILFVLMPQTACTVSNFNVETIQGDTFNLMELSNSSENFFVVLFSWSYNCFDCFKGIVKDLDSLSKQQDLDYIFVSSSDESSLNRRRQIETIRKIKKDAEIYFDIPRRKNIFNRYKVDVTPAVIHIKNSKITFISFDNFTKRNHRYYDILKELLV